MKIAVAVDGSRRDPAVLDWAGRFARPGDDVHVVHAYQELALHGSPWLPAVRATDRRRHDARRIVTTAQSVLHATLATRDRQIVVGGSPITGWPHQVLADVSTIADLLVVGTRPGPGPVCGIEAECPVVVIPEGWTSTGERARSVGVVCGREVGARAMDRAVGLARRAGLTVMVLQVDDPAQFDASALERLDLQVAHWDAPDGPPIVTEIRHEGLGAALHSLEHVLALVVVDPDSIPGNDAARIALDDLNLPVVLDAHARAAPAPPRAVASLRGTW